MGPNTTPSLKQPALPADELVQTLRDNPACASWSGPHGGVPPFDRIAVQDLGPALRAAMQEQLAEIALIGNNPEPVTFENTIAAYQRSGQSLDRASSIFSVLSASMSTEELRALEEEIEPVLAQHSDRIIQDEKLFARIEAVRASLDASAPTLEQRRLVTLLHSRFARSGARLSPPQKEELSRINQKLASLYSRFSQNVLKAESAALFIEDRNELVGLPASLVDSMARAASDLRKAGSWALVNTRSIVEPILAYSPNRELRKRAFNLFASRGDGGEHDNNQIIPEITQLRAQRAKLLGFATHAHVQLEETMARTPERALSLMHEVWKSALGRLEQELREVREIAAREGLATAIEPWDVRFYQEKVRTDQYSVNEAEITPYLQVAKLRDGMFFTASKLFKLSFHRAPGGSVPTYHPDVEVWEVRNEGGAHVGLLYFDPFHHEGKRSGAWMKSYRDQQLLDGPVTPIVSNDCNFMKGSPGQPSLLTWVDATTLFHEFGHALHGLCSNVTYPTLSGTSVSQDFVELPSQLLEHWLETPEVLAQFALHHETGAPMPPELVEKLREAQNFNSGFTTVEYLSCALLDMELHLAGEVQIEPSSFEREALARIGMPREVIMRHRLPHFLHIFGDDGYSAGYYSYLWADTLAADAWEAFLEAGSPWDEGVAARLRAHILSAGNVQEPLDAYRAFRGRDAGSGALMRQRGFA